MTTKFQKSIDRFEKDLDKVFDDIEKTFNSTLTKTKMRRLGKEAVKIVRRRTLLGKGVTFVSDDNKKNKKLKPLSPSYKKFRKRFKKKGGLSTKTKVGKSNLTLTGQMLKSLQVSTRKKKSFVLLTSGPRKNSKYTNEDIARFVSEQGRPWLDLSNLEQKKLARFYQNNILKPIMAKI